MKTNVHTNHRKRSVGIAAGLTVCVILVLTLSLLISGLSQPFVSAQAHIAIQNVTGQFDTSGLISSQFNTSVMNAGQVKTYERRTVIISLRGGGLVEAAQGTDVAAYAAGTEGTGKTADMRAAQDALLAQLDGAGVDYTLKARYFALDNAVAVELDTSYVKELCRMPGVDSVVISRTYAYPQTTTSDATGAVSNVTSVYGTGIYDSSDAVADGLDGSGTVIAILDTGIDYTHPAFSEMPSGTCPVRFTEEDIANILASGDLRAEAWNQTQLSAADVYINAKIPFAYDYADKDADVYPSYSTHGTHVAGIVAGHDVNGYTDKNGNHVDQPFIGVAPQAQLVICKVFTDDLESLDLGGAVTEDILSALEDCVLLGVDVINMSLGTSCGFTTTDDGDDEGEYMNRVYTLIGAQGINLICAASNDYSAGYGSVFGTNLTTNPDSGTVGSPSTFASALAVASISGKKSPYLMGNGETPVFFEESNDADGNPYDFISMMLSEGVDTAEFEYVVVPGVGRASDYTSAIRKLFADNPNRIALVARGDTTFKEKVEIAMSMGARAIMVYNNVSGTIRMSLGEVEDPIPAVSIDMNVGRVLVDAALNHTPEALAAGAVNRVGRITIDRTLTAGPFMSDFSSWGCTPDLKLKPEVTAHGGEISSAVPGGYDEQSGTSMASPNMAGVVALIRSYVKQNNPDMTPTEVTRRVNQLLMSTSSMVYDRDGLPYSPRKQGAGLGSLDNSRTTGAFLWTDNAAIDNRPKAELGDDKEKRGVYTLSFLVTNFSENALDFRAQSVFMTETLSVDKLTVAQQAYLLTDMPAVWKLDGIPLTEGQTFAVPAGATRTLELTLTLSEAEKQYMDESFENGMFVEGFARLISQSAGQCDLELPFMGFYGDWAAAPMLDYDAYELAGYQQDSSILEDQKPQASVWATQPYTVYSDGQYVLPMGSYVYLLPDDADPVYTSMEHNAISCFNNYFGKYDENNYLTAYRMKGLYAGLLRNARSVDWTLTDAITGEVLQSDTVYRVGKAYADGGSARPAFVDVPLDPAASGLISNGCYTMSFTFYMDWGDGSCRQNTFSYDFTVDYEAPLLQDARIRYYTYKDGSKTRQKIYLDLDVFDNHYAQSAMLCYLDGDQLSMATDYVTPIYNANRNGTTTVSIEITDIYAKYKDSLYVQLDDYALNHSVYWLNLSAVNSSTVTEDFTLAEGEEALTLAVYDTHTVKLNGLETSDLSNVRWTSDNRSVADVSNGEIVGLSEGQATVTVSGGNGVTHTIRVTVTAGDKTLPTPSISFGTIRDGAGTLCKAQGLVEVYPGQTFSPEVLTDPWYYPADRLDLVWSSTNPDVASVDEEGHITVIKEGAAVISAAIRVDGQMTAYTATVTLKVKDPFEVSNYSLVKYHGTGGVVVIPTDKNIMQIGEEAFKDHQTITEVVIPKSVTAIGRSAFENCTALQRISFDKPYEQPIADADISVIHARAFAGCTALEVLDLSNVKVVTLGRECFAGCTSLREISQMTKIGSAFDYAFSGCTSLTEIDLTGTRVSGYGVFAGCTALTDIRTCWFSAIGEAMFSGCTSLRCVDICASSIGDRAFENCTALRSVCISLPDGTETFTHSIGASAFAGCTALQTFDVRPGCRIAAIGDYAFSGTALSSFALPEGLTSLGKHILAGAPLTCLEISDSFDWTSLRLTGVPFGYPEIRLAPDCTKYTIQDGVLYDKDRTMLLLVLPGTTRVTVPATVTAIDDYAFAGSMVTTLTLPSSVTSIGVGAFENSRLTQVDLSATQLTVIPDHAFAGTRLVSVSIPASVTAIGDEAFAGTPLTEVTFAGNALTELGHAVFSDCTDLRRIALPDSIRTMGRATFVGCANLVTVTMPSVTVLGDRTFADCTSLCEVTFGENATTLGQYTFYRNTALTAVRVGAGTTAVGDGCFCGCDSLAFIDLRNITFVGDHAFEGCGSLAVVDGLDRVVTVGQMAFYNCTSLRKLTLTAAEDIRDGAFAMEEGSTAYTELSVPSVRHIGVMAFMGGRMTAVTLPATLETMGYGAFCDTAALTRFDVDSHNEIFFEHEGVLYRRLPNGGYELSAYPSGRVEADGCYTVPEGTVSVAAYAFNRLGKDALSEIDLPYSVKFIGASAFFRSGITIYTFRSMQAPALGTMYREDVTQLLQSYATGNQIVINGLYYANFETLFAYYTEIIGQTSDLTMRIPEGGRGYDNYIYSRYFGTSESLGILMDDTTRAAITAIQALPTEETVSGWLTLPVDESNRAMILSFADQVREARRLYNNILSTDQLALVPDELRDQLTSIEGLVRQLKEMFGIPLVISEIRPDSGYRKEYTEGEHFSMEGLTLTVVYDDGSTGPADPDLLTLVSPADGVLTIYDNFVVFEYVYGQDARIRVDIPVTVRAGSAVPGWETDEETGPVAGEDRTAWVAPVVVCGVLALCIGGCVIMVRLYRRWQATRPRRLRYKAKRGNPVRRARIRRILVWTAVGLVAVGAVVTMILSAGDKRETTGHESVKLDMQMVYHANGGSFENNMSEKTIGYRSGAYPLNIGQVIVTNGSAGITRPNYSFLGWFYAAMDENGHVLYENEADGIVKLGEPYDFTTPLGRGEDIHVYAGWSKDKTLPVILAGCDLTDKSGKTYQVGDVLRELTANSAGQFVKFTGSNLLRLPTGAYTFVQYYMDEACTLPVNWPLTAGEEDEAAPIYARFIEGNWKIVSDAASAKKMLSSLITGNYYVIADIDLQDAAVTISNNATFGACVEGNGHTISNFCVTKRGVESQGTSLFGTWKPEACLHDLTLSDVDFRVLLKGDATAVYFLFGSMPEDYDIAGLDISGTMTISCPDGATVGNLQSTVHDHWVLSAGETDDTALANGRMAVHVTCIVGEETYVYPDTSLH